MRFDIPPAARKIRAEMRPFWRLGPRDWALVFRTRHRNERRLRPRPHPRRMAATPVRSISRTRSHEVLAPKLCAVFLF